MCPMIQNLRVMRDEDELPFVLLDGILRGKQPRLNLAHRNKIVRLVDKNCIVLFRNKEVKDHIKRN